MAQPEEAYGTSVFKELRQLIVCGTVRGTNETEKERQGVEDGDGVEERSEGHAVY